MAKKFGLSTDRWLGLLQRERDIKPDEYRREIIWPSSRPSWSIAGTIDGLKNAAEAYEYSIVK